MSDVDAMQQRLAALERESQELRHRLGVGAAEEAKASDEPPTDKDLASILAKLTAELVALGPDLVLELIALLVVVALVYAVTTKVSMPARSCKATQGGNKAVWQEAATRTHALGKPQVQAPPKLDKVALSAVRPPPGLELDEAEGSGGESSTSAGPAASDVGTRTDSDVPEHDTEPVEAAATKQEESVEAKAKQEEAAEADAKQEEAEDHAREEETAEADAAEEEAESAVEAPKNEAKAEVKTRGEEEKDGEQAATQVVCPSSPSPRNCEVATSEAPMADGRPAPVPTPSRRNSLKHGGSHGGGQATSTKKASAAAPAAADLCTDDDLLEPRRPRGELLQGLLARLRPLLVPGSNCQSTGSSPTAAGGAPSKHKGRKEASKGSKAKKACHEATAGAPQPSRSLRWPCGWRMTLAVVVMLGIILLGKLPLEGSAKPSIGEAVEKLKAKQQELAALQAKRAQLEEKLAILELQKSAVQLAAKLPAERCDGDDAHAS